MRYKDIRNAFPKCGVAVIDDGIMLVMPQYNPTRRIGQTIDDSEFCNKKILLDLLEKCTSVRIGLIIGVCTYILFEIQLAIDVPMVWNPVSPELTEQELREIVFQKIIEHDNGEALRAVIKNVDLSSEEQIVDAFTHNIHDVNQDTYKLGSVYAWQPMKSIADQLGKQSKGWEYYEEPPDEDIDFGVISLLLKLGDNKSKYYQIGKDPKQKLLELCHIADSISIESETNNKDAFILLEFYS